jgi:crossover junction endodeoxyribonuclease RusA
MSISFTVSGQAKPKGSMRAFTPKGSRFPILTSSNASLKDWEQIVRHVAQKYSDVYTTGPVRIRLRFNLPRPKSLSAKVSRPHTKRPDVDKLARAVLDALTGVLFKDDSQVYYLTATKMYANFDEPPNVRITVNTKDE